MSFSRRYGFLPFIYANEYNDWQLKGYYKNAILSLINVPYDRLVSFMTPLIYGSYTAPASFLIRKIKIVDNSVVVINQKEETTTLIKVEQTIYGVLYSYYYWNQQVLSENLTKGYIYDIYIEDIAGNQLISNPFLAVQTQEFAESKPIFKRDGFLPFYKMGEKTDWQLKGYFNNWIRSLKRVSYTYLVSFRTPLIDGSYTVPSTMKLRRLKVIDNEVSVISETSLTSGLIKDTYNGFTYYYREASAIITPLELGCIYDIYITDGVNEFISDVMLAVGERLFGFVLGTEDGKIITTEDGKYIGV